MEERNSIPITVEYMQPQQVDVFHYLKLQAGKLLRRDAKIVDKAVGDTIEAEILPAVVMHDPIKPVAETPLPEGSDTSAQPDEFRVRTPKYDRFIYTMLGAHYLFSTVGTRHKREAMLTKSREDLSKVRADEVDPKKIAWTVMDSGLRSGRDSLDEQFAPVILPTGARNIQEDVEATLADYAGERLGLEVGGHGSAVFQEFPSGFFSESRGVALSDGRTLNARVADGSIHNEVITTEDVFDDLADNGVAALSTWLDGRKLAYVHERMEGGLLMQPQDPYRFFASFNGLYQLVGEGGLMHIQLPDIAVPLMRDWAAKNEREHPGALGMTFGKCAPVRNFPSKERWTMRLQKGIGAPDVLSALDISEVHAAYADAASLLDVAYKGVMAPVPGSSYETVEIGRSVLVAAEAISCLLSDGGETKRLGLDGNEHTVRTAIIEAEDGTGLALLEAAFTSQHNTDEHEAHVEPNTIKISWLDTQQKFEGTLTFSTDPTVAFVAKKLPAIRTEGVSVGTRTLCEKWMAETNAMLMVDIDPSNEYQVERLLDILETGTPNIELAKQVLSAASTPKSEAIIPQMAVR